MHKTPTPTPGTSVQLDGKAKDRVGRVDPYGFERPEDFDYEAYEEFMSRYMVVLTNRAIKWSKLLKTVKKLQKNEKLKRYIRKGIPNEHRTVIWMATSGAQDQLEKNPGYYQSMLLVQPDDKLKDSIERDLHRTFPENVYFNEKSKPCLQKLLYNVLMAYGHHNPTVGYCQGMNFIAGYLLIITKDEENSFWLLDALVSRILPDYYTPAMLGLKTDQEVLAALVKTKSPQVWRIMKEHNVLWSLVTSRWFICLFIDTLPVETVLRVWDCLFYEGSKILFRVALTLIIHSRAVIEKAGSMPGVCNSFKQITKGEFVENCHPFMEKIFTEPGHFPMSTVTKYRTMFRARILQEESPPSPAAS